MVVCEICGKTISNAEKLRKHKIAVHQRKDFVCGICFKGFPFKGKLNIHMVKHSDERNFKCDCCLKMFKTRSDLLQHRRTHGKEPYYCTNCNIGFEDQEVYHKHIKDHQRNQHKLKEKKPLQKPDPSKYTCHICQKVLSNKRNHKAHVEAVHHKIKNYTCVTCQRDFYDKKTLSRHLKLLKHADVTSDSEEGPKSEVVKFQKRHKKTKAKIKKVDKIKNLEEVYIVEIKELIALEGVPLDVTHTNDDLIVSIKSEKFPDEEVCTESELLTHDLSKYNDQSQFEVKEEGEMKEVSNFSEDLKNQETLNSAEDDLSLQQRFQDTITKLVSPAQFVECKIEPDFVEISESFEFPGRNFEEYDKSLEDLTINRELSKQSIESSKILKRKSGDAENCDKDKKRLKKDMKDQIKGAKSKKGDKNEAAPQKDPQKKSAKIVKLEKEQAIKTQVFFCSICTMHFANYRSLRSHQLNKHIGTDRQKQCNFCGEIFTKLSLKKHIAAVHIKKKLLECEICLEKFTNHTHKRKHKVQTHLNGLKLLRECGLCKESFHLADDFFVHIAEHSNSFICTICGESLENQSSLDVHSSKHRRWKDLIRKKLLCDICGGHFSTKQTMEVHLRSHSNTFPYLCPICAKKFKNQTSFEFHKKMHAGDFQFECKECFRKFSTKQNLKIHEQKHTNELRYSCTICEQKFMYHKSYKMHMDQHEGLPATEYKCSYCSRMLKTKETLKSHEYQHTGFRPNICGFCEKSYTLAKNLKHHVRRHHANEVGVEEFLSTIKARESVVTKV